MRTFDHFPKDKKFPLCGSNKDAECFLAPIDGTDKENICEAIPIHAECLQNDGWRYNNAHGIIYKFTEGLLDERNT